MRRRLVPAFLTVALCAVLLTCIPLGLIASSLIRQDFDHRLDRNTQFLRAALIEISAHGRPVTRQLLAGLVPSGRRAVLTTPSGAHLTAGEISGPAVTERVRLDVGTLAVSAPTRLLHARLRHIWLLIGGLGLAAVAIAFALAVVAAKRLERPVKQLVKHAERLGSGDVRPIPDRFGISELDSLAEVLDRSARRLAGLLDDAARWSRETSHQLRTPLTSLRLRLESVRAHDLDPADRVELDAALAQIERLTTLVRSSLQRGDGAGPPRATDVGEILARQLREWEPAFVAAGRTVTATGAAGVRAAVTPGGLEQALSCLLENALAHGAGATTLRYGSDRGFVTIDVADDGPGVPDELADRIFERDVSGGSGTGLGLAMARSVIESEGGRLMLTRRVPARFTVFLPPAAGAHS